MHATVGSTKSVADPGGGEGGGSCWKIAKNFWGWACLQTPLEGLYTQGYTR